jgi:hypothetical protein
VKVVVIGPEGSGSWMLTQCIRDGLRIEDTVHRSIPHGGVRVPWHIDAETSEPWGQVHYVVITRRPDVTALSTLARGLAPDLGTAQRQWRDAVAELAHIPGATWVSYEAFIADPGTQLMNIARALGMTFVFPDVIPGIFDASEKWYDQVGWHA